MKQTHLLTILLALFLCTSAAAQERGDGLAAPGKEDHGIITGRPPEQKKLSLAAKGTSKWFDINMRQLNPDGTPVNAAPGISEYGVKAGLNCQQMAHSSFTNTFFPGALAGVYFRRHWRFTAIKIELLGTTGHYTSAQAVGSVATPAENNTSKSTFNTTYLSLPALAQLRIHRDPDLWLEVGPQYTYLLTYSDKSDIFSKEYGQDNIFKRSEFSGVIGAEYKINTRFKVDLRYAKGLTDVNNSVYPQAYLQWNINSIQATLSYKLY